MLRFEKFRRAPAATEPPTYTSQEVTRILGGEMTTTNLADLDSSGYLRPSYYFSHGVLLTPSAREDWVRDHGVSQGCPRRRYTYSDLPWLRLFGKLKGALAGAGRRSAVELAGRAVQTLRKRFGNTCPPTARVVVIGSHAWFLRDGEVAECLTDAGVQAMVPILTDQVLADVEARVTLLETAAAIRAIRSGSAPAEFPSTASSRS